MDRKIIGIYKIIFSILIWSSSEVAIKMVQQSLPPIFTASLRFILGSIFIFFIFLFKNKTYKSFSFVGIKNTIFAAITGIVFSFGSIHLSIKYIDAFLSSSLLCFAPLFFPIIDRNIPVRPQSYKVLLLFIILILLALLLSDNFNSTELLIMKLKGILLSFIGSFFFAYYLIIMSHEKAEESFDLLLILSTFLGGIILLAFSLLFENYNFITTTKDIIILLWLSLFVVAFARISFFSGIKDFGSIWIGSLPYLLKPALAIFLAFIFVDEVPSAYEGIAVAILMSALSIFLIINNYK